MAIFASTTLGTGDPSRAMNIKALEARAQALSAAQAKQEMPTSLPSPWQGASLVMNQAADAFAIKRADQQAQEQKAQLAALMGQIGPEGPNPQQLAGITARDTDFGKMYAQQAFQARQGAEAIQAQKDRDAAKVESDKGYLAEQDRLAQAHPQTDQGKVKADLAAGRISQEEADAALKKLNAGAPAEQKLAAEQQNENIDLQAGAQGIDQAMELLKTGKVYSNSSLAGLRTEYGQSIPKMLQGAAGVDPESTDISKRYSQLIKVQVMPILNRLKGSMSNADREWAISTIDSPSSTLDAKMQVLTRLKTQMDAHLKQSNLNLKESGRTVVQVAPSSGASTASEPGGGGGGDDAAARAWLADPANANSPHRAGVERRLKGGQ